MDGSSFKSFFDKKLESMLPLNGSLKFNNYVVKYTITHTEKEPISLSIQLLDNEFQVEKNNPYFEEIIMSLRCIFYNNPFYENGIHNAVFLLSENSILSNHSILLLNDTDFELLVNSVDAELGIIELEFGGIIKSLKKSCKHNSKKAKWPL